MSPAAFVTLVVGEAYARLYDEHIRPSHERLAARTGHPLIVLRAPIDAARDTPHPHPSWLKLRVFDAPEAARFERLCWLDADLYAMDGAPDPFALAPEGAWLAVPNDVVGGDRQRRHDLGWLWMARDAPPVLLNSGLFVADRGAHAELLRAIHRSYAGVWDQGPFAFHLQDVPGVLGPGSLNRLVVHHLVAHRFLAAGLRSLVDGPGFVHFAAAPALRAHLFAYVRAVDRGDLRTARRIEGGALARAPRGLAETAWFDVRAAARDGSLAAMGRPFARALLRRALRARPRLLLSPHGTTRTGLVAVDVLARVATRDAVKLAGGGASAPLAMDVGDALAVARGLQALESIDVLERLAPADRAAHLARCVHALAPGGELRVAVLTTDVEGPPAFHAGLARACTMSAAELGALARDVGVRRARIVRGGSPEAPGLPRSYAVLLARAAG